MTNDLRYLKMWVDIIYLTNQKNMNLGHIITAERLSTGELVIFDPQVGDKLVWDNLYVNLNLVKGIVLKD